MSSSVTSSLSVLLFLTLLLGLNKQLLASEQFDAELINKAGSAAAGFAQASDGSATDAMVEEKFGPLGKSILKIAKQWIKDPELEEAPPAFRRFLFFDYMTKGTNIIAVASNPDELLINGDASVDLLFDDDDVVSAAKKAMEERIEQPRHEVLANYKLSIFPMIPPAEKAQQCIECHASDAVGRPYPDGQKVLGYTLVAIPK